MAGVNEYRLNVLITAMLMHMKVDQLTDRRYMSIMFRRCSKQIVGAMDIVGEGGDLCSFKPPVTHYS